MGSCHMTCLFSSPAKQGASWRSKFVFFYLHYFVIFSNHDKQRMKYGNQPWDLKFLYTSWKSRFLPPLRMPKVSLRCGYQSIAVHHTICRSTPKLMNNYHSIASFPSTSFYPLVQMMSLLDSPPKTLTTLLKRRPFFFSRQFHLLSSPAKCRTIQTPRA